MGGGWVGEGGGASKTAAVSGCCATLKAKLPIPWWVALAAIFWVVSMISYSAPWGKKQNPHIAWHGAQFLKYFALLSVACVIGPILVRAVASLRNCSMDINVLMSLACVGALAVGDYIEGAAVIVLFSLSDVLEKRATESVRNSLAALVALRPESATLADTGEVCY